SLYLVAHLRGMVILVTVRAGEVAIHVRQYKDIETIAILNAEAYSREDLLNLVDSIGHPEPVCVKGLNHHRASVVRGQRAIQYCFGLNTESIWKCDQAAGRGIEDQRLGSFLIRGDQVELGTLHARLPTDILARTVASPEHR